MKRATAICNLQSSPHLARMLGQDDDCDMLVAFLMPGILIDAQIFARHTIHEGAVGVVLECNHHAAQLQVAIWVVRVHDRERDALVAYNRGDQERRATLLKRSLTLARTCEDSAGIAEVLLWQANIAAELFGAADAARAANRLGVVPGALPDIEQDRAAVRATLGETAFAAALAYGVTRPIEDVITAALAGAAA